ncbi:hypothetical protein AX774_g1542 [Zancudomyces culisetae]|uniref:Uncharacterized protein n=1 Tax=Zancudomyces culisetae TaxID=1213189 RepID=A0A1R1PVH4_ZANCU|nr:hypothetical protein AX774_g1542 [Zancudomyces culisetae]|eukprot:OMH84929.1 hypothetical protein AX774_g1542 [Zancudomyces culisetae]
MESSKGVKNNKVEHIKTAHGINPENECTYDLYPQGVRYADCLSIYAHAQQVIRRDVTARSCQHRDQQHALNPLALSLHPLPVVEATWGMFPVRTQYGIIDFP